METKPGWKTTEWWITIFTALVTFGVSAGLISTAEAGELTDAVSKIGGAVTMILGALAVIWKFIESRRSVKVEVAKANAEIAKAQPQEAQRIMQKQI